MHTLSIEALPTKFYWNQGLPSPRALHSIPHSLRWNIEGMMRSGIITRKDSFGFAMADPRVDYTQCWDDPERLIALIAYWGTDGLRFAANAVRKIRAAARTKMDTQLLRLNHPELFRDTVESMEPDGTFQWGDFPYDGAVHLNMLGLHLLGAVSVFPKEEDPIVASLILGVIGLEMHKSNQANQ